MEKTKKQGFFKNVKNSIFNFDSYQEFAMQDMKKGIFYFLKLSILFSVVISIVFAALQVTVTVPNVKKFIEGDIPNFSYSNGTLDLQSEEPVTIDKIADDVLIIADTKELDDAKINEYKDKINLYEIGVLILKDKIYLKNAYTLSEIQEMKLSDMERVNSQNKIY